MNVCRFSMWQGGDQKNPCASESPGERRKGKRSSLLPFLLTLIKRNEAAEGRSFRLGVIAESSGRQVEQEHVGDVASRAFEVQLA